MRTDSESGLEREFATRITCAVPEHLRVLSPEQRSDYERDGFIALPGLVSEDWLARLRAVSAEFVEKSRALTESTRLCDLESDHTAERPRLRRLVSPADLHPTFWEFASEKVLEDVDEDLIGPDIKFHHS